MAFHRIEHKEKTIRKEKNIQLCSGEIFRYRVCFYCGRSYPTIIFDALEYLEHGGVLRCTDKRVCWVMYQDKLHKQKKERLDKEERKKRLNESIKYEQNKWQSYK